MSKIGIVTFHRANNYGVCLQAYATAAFLSEHGNDVHIIDYTNPYEQRIQKWSYKENNRISGYITSLLKNIVLGKMYYYKKAFGEVTNNYPLTEKRYFSKDEMMTLNYDILIAGSDQIWNPTITNGIDDVFLLQFGNASKRISVASSMGSSEPNDYEKELIKTAFASFSAISVREEFAAKILQPYTDKHIKVLMDPTFLLDKTEWIERMGKKSKYIDVREKYILTYFVGHNKQEYQNRVKAIADKLKLPVWTIQYSNYNWSVSSKKILGATIEDFIALISNAELVLTDSFHGTAFSINLEANFIAFKHKTNPVRVMGLLDKLGIMERLDMNEDTYSVLDYSVVSDKLERLREESQKWVLDAVNS